MIHVSQSVYLARAVVKRNERRYRKEMQSLNYYSRRNRCNNSGRGPASGDVSEDEVGGADRIILERGEGRKEKETRVLSFDGRLII